MPASALKAGGNTAGRSPRMNRNGSSGPPVFSPNRAGASKMAG